MQATTIELLLAEKELEMEAGLASSRSRMEDSSRSMAEYEYNLE
jgi:hypothetical protein